MYYGSVQFSVVTELEKLQHCLGDSYTDFEVFASVEKMSYVLGSEFWEN